jgi:hypothetical protein
MDLLAPLQRKLPPLLRVVTSNRAVRTEIAQLYSLPRELPCLASKSSFCTLYPRIPSVVCILLPRS